MKIDGGSTYRYAPCSENKPEVEFNVKDQILFKGIPEKPVVIYNFEDMYMCYKIVVTLNFSSISTMKI